MDERTFGVDGKVVKPNEIQPGLLPLVENTISGIPTASVRAASISHASANRNP
jgi:hypothetical protein